MIRITDGRTPKARACPIHRDPYDDAPSCSERDGGNDRCGPVVSPRVLEAAREFSPLIRGVCAVHGETVGLEFANGERLCYECGRTLTGGPS